MLHGIISALITPFDANEDIDEKALETLINWTIGKGINGVFIVSSTGESWALSFEEKVRLFRAAVSIVDKRVPVIAGVGVSSTREAIRLSEAAQAAGADYRCAAPPSFIRPSQDELITHYSALARANDIPLLLYNIPMLAVNVLDTPGVKTVADRYPNIVGIKDSSGDLAVVHTLMLHRRPDFGIFTGIDTLVLPGLMAGTQGAILGSANIYPELALEIFDLFEAGQIEKASAIQNRMNRIWAAMGLGSFPASIKAAMELMGLPAGSPRQPVAPLNAENRNLLRRELKAAGLLN